MRHGSFERQVVPFLDEMKNIPAGFAAETIKQAGVKIDRQTGRPVRMERADVLGFLAGSFQIGQFAGIKDQKSSLARIWSLTKSRCGCVMGRVAIFLLVLPIPFQEAEGDFFGKYSIRAGPEVDTMPLLPGHHRRQHRLGV